MCGICGQVDLERRPVETGPVQAMMDAMMHRGPDAGGMFREPGIAAGIRRLAVIDLQHGNQPIASEDGGVTVVFNGEIYNYREIRQDLLALGHSFKTGSVGGFVSELGWWYTNSIGSRVTRTGRMIRLPNRFDSPIFNS